MDKKAQGLPISTIILAVLGLVVLVILFAIVTGRMAIFGRGISECPGRCVDPHLTAVQGPWPGACSEGIEKELVGNYVAVGQTNVKADQLQVCNKCCVPIA